MISKTDYSDLEELWFENKNKNKIENVIADWEREEGRGDNKFAAEQHHGPHLLITESSSGRIAGIERNDQRIETGKTRHPRQQTRRHRRTVYVHRTPLQPVQCKKHLHKCQIRKILHELVGLSSGLSSVSFELSHHSNELSFNKEGGMSSLICILIKLLFE